ncbi:DNA mismatch repair protein MutS [Marinilabiliaceae bacterium JC017]|nr:DNA mismatch repair protein MutS [Marinilabiliaceae bacterium JC017]
MKLFQRKKQQLEDLKASFGKIKEEDYDFESISKYHNRKDNSGYFQVISEKTCNDLDFEQLFQFLDRTTSKVGQQHLYHRLRCLSRDNATLETMERLVQRFQKEEDLRLDTQYLLTKLTDPEACYIADLFQTDYKKPPQWYFVIPLLSLTNVISLVLSFFMPQYLLIVLVVTIANLIIHYWNKRNVYEYITSIPQLLRMYKVAKSLLTKIPESEPTNLPHILANMNNVRNKMSIFKLESGILDDMKAISDTLFELVKIVFLVEPIVLFKVLNQLEDKKEEIEVVHTFIGTLDTAISIASLRKGLDNFCRPTITGPQKRLEAITCVHPLMEQCVPNSIALHDTSMLLTGSNMSGKTTFIRTIGINVLTALTINTCFAESFTLPRLRLYSAIRITDDLMNDRSYYFEEVVTIKEMMAQGGKEVQNLFLLDELYKGTNTIERISGGKAVLSYLNQGNNIVMVSTHDVELTDLLNQEYMLSHFTESVSDRTIDFDYKLKPGRLTSRNAIKILEMNDYPAEVIREARELAEEMDEKKMLLAN